MAPVLLAWGVPIYSRGYGNAVGISETQLVFKPAARLESKRSQRRLRLKLSGSLRLRNGSFRFLAVRPLLSTAWVFIMGY